MTYDLPATRRSFSPPLIGERSIVMNVSVCSSVRFCFSVCPQSYIQKCMSNLRQIVTPPPIGSAEYCDERVCLSVCQCMCLCVCLSAIISLELHVRSSPIFFCVLPMAVARSSSGGVVTRHVLPFLWMTSILLISQGCSTSPPS